jgi:short subunit dehydrogenase-like uncharacterized protein
MSGFSIAVYGATGHTGRLVAAELVARGHQVLLAGRNGAALQSVANAIGGDARVHEAHLDDAESLSRLARGSEGVINCAGPFSITGGLVASAAIEAGRRYVDHAAEPMYVKQAFDTDGARAEAAGSVVLPGMSFYGGLADLLAHVVTGDVPRVDRLTVGYAMSGWRMTATSKATAQRLMQGERVRFADGHWWVEPFERTLASFDFPDPLHRRPVLVHYPAGEVVTIPRHVAARAVDVVMTAETFQEEAVFTSERIDADERARSTYAIVVRAEAEGRARTGVVRGEDLYRTGAVTAVEAMERILGGARTVSPGVRSGAEAFPASELLRALEARGVIRTEFPRSTEERSA